MAMQALNDDEALRAPHPVADLAEWEGAEDIRISITAFDGRDVGFVGDGDDDAGHMERSERRTPTYRHPPEES